MNAKELKLLGERIEGGDPLKDWYNEGELIAELHAEVVRLRAKNPVNQGNTGIAAVKIEAPDLDADLAGYTSEYQKLTEHAALTEKTLLKFFKRRGWTTGKKQWEKELLASALEAQGKPVPADLRTPGKSYPR